MSAKKRGPRTPAEVQADIERAPEQNRLGTVQFANENAQHGVGQRTSALHEVLELVQHARDLELTQTGGLSFGGVGAIQRLLIAVLESLTPEQRAEVKRRLG